MTKQEEIMREVDKILLKSYGDDEGVVARDIMGYLHSQGVVIKAVFDGTSKDRVFTTIEPLIKKT